MAHKWHRFQILFISAFAKNKHSAFLSVKASAAFKLYFCFWWVLGLILKSLVLLLESSFHSCVCSWSLCSVVLCCSSSAGPVPSSPSFSVNDFTGFWYFLSFSFINCPCFLLQSLQYFCCSVCSVSFQVFLINLPYLVCCRIASTSAQDHLQLVDHQGGGMGVTKVSKEHEDTSENYKTQTEYYKEGVPVTINNCLGLIFHILLYANTRGERRLL